MADVSDLPLWDRVLLAHPEIDLSDWPTETHATRVPVPELSTPDVGTLAGDLGGPDGVPVETVPVRQARNTHPGGAP